MPDGRTHDVITVATGAALVPVGLIALQSIGLPPDVALTCTASMVGAHLLSGIMFSPDLDLDSRIDDRWGIFYWIWRPYMWLVPHRHFWSHGLIIPPLLRLLYFYWMVVGILIVGAWLLGLVGIVVPSYHIQLREALIGLMARYPRETWSFMLGFITGAAAHTIADWAVTNGRRHMRRLGIRITGDYRNHDRWNPRAQRRRSRSWGR